MTDHVTITAEVVEAAGSCTLAELCELCNVDADWVAMLVEHGVIVPGGRAQAEWTFARVSVLRVRKAQRLEHDLGLNMPGLALALDLLDEIDALRARLRAHEQV